MWLAALVVSRCRPVVGIGLCRVVHRHFRTCTRKSCVMGETGNVSTDPAQAGKKAAACRAVDERIQVSAFNF